ncbi:MAG: exodeoxyribonuclease III [Candidatus Xenobiia bacterium LiM19]
MNIATWNVNSVRSRLPAVIEWLRNNSPDALCLQETKVQDGDFPREAFAEAGYSSHILGQKTYNGVSIHTREDAVGILAGFPDEKMNEQKRVISLRLGDIRIVNVYVPQGESIESAKFAYKLDFLDHLIEYLRNLLSRDEKIVLLGDFNIAPDKRDLYDAPHFSGQVMFHQKEHERLEALRALGFKDALRLLNQEAGLYSWWDYRNGAFWKNRGFRLDLIWLSERLAPQCTAVTIDRNMRKGKQPSDHVPVIAALLA